MAYEKKDGDLTLSINNKTNDNQPDLRGSVRMAGKDYEVALWAKNGKNGKFYSGRIGKEVQPRERSFGQSTFKKQEQTSSPKFDDNVPWDT